MTRVTVDFEWQALGPVSLDDAGRLVFPALPAVPGLYRILLQSVGRRAEVYIGESDNLKRRAQNYRTPGPSQRTNQRLNHKLIGALSAGGSLSMATVTSASILIDGEAPRPLDLTRKISRVIVEHAAMAAVLDEQEREGAWAPRLVNRPGVGEEEWTAPASGENGAARIVEEPVDPSGEVMVLWHGDGDAAETVALIGRRADGRFAVEFVMPSDRAGAASIREKAANEARYYLVDKGEPDPWAYAKYHVTTAANVYSEIHWSWHPDGWSGQPADDDSRRSRRATF